MAVKIISPALENYVRDWCGYQVDKNLKDAWLQRLNLLRCFDLLGVCEGHFSCNDDVPYIVVRAREQYCMKLISMAEKVGLLLVGLATSSTDYRVVSMFDFPKGPFIGEDSKWLFKISLTSLEARTSLDMGCQTEDWFENSISEIENIDEKIYCLLESSVPNDYVHSD